MKLSFALLVCAVLLVAGPALAATGSASKTPPSRTIDGLLWGAVTATVTDRCLRPDIQTNGILCATGGVNWGLYGVAVPRDTFVEYIDLIMDGQAGLAAGDTLVLNLISQPTLAVISTFTIEVDACGADCVRRWTVNTLVTHEDDVTDAIAIRVTSSVDPGADSNWDINATITLRDN